LTPAAAKVQVALVPNGEMSEKRSVSPWFEIPDRESGVK
jgi:hypothetical protein